MNDAYIVGWGHTVFGKLDNVDLEQLIRGAVQPNENTFSLNDRLAPSVAAVYATGTLADVKQSG